MPQRNQEERNFCLASDNRLYRRYKIFVTKNILMHGACCRATGTSYSEARRKRRLMGDIRFSQILRASERQASPKITFNTISPRDLYSSGTCVRSSIALLVTRSHLLLPSQMGDKIIAGNRAVFSREAFGRHQRPRSGLPDKPLMLLYDQAGLYRATPGIRRGDIHPVPAVRPAHTDPRGGGARTLKRWSCAMLGRHR